MKSILITGAYGGMGRAAVKLFAERGMRVFALDLKEGEAYENVVPISVDITKEQSILAAFNTVREQCDGLYAILHFAGIYMLDSLAELAPSEYDRIFDVNVRGAYLVNKIFLPLLSENSRILITTSELAPLDPLPFTGIYAITKAAVEKYAYSLRMEMNLLGISVSIIRPGATKTPLLGDSTSALDKFVNNTKIYKTNSARFKKIVDSVEAKNVEPSVIGNVAYRIIEAKKPRYVYNINRNPLLLILNALPQRLQNFIIKLILTK